MVNTQNQLHLKERFNMNHTSFAVKNIETVTVDLYLPLKMCSSLKGFLVHKTPQNQCDLDWEDA